MQAAQARGNLRHALSRIRKALPAGARPGLILDGPTVALDPSIVDVDVAHFERLVADGGLPLRAGPGRRASCWRRSTPGSTEGFDTAELQAVKALLDRLRQ
jgi:hypothetical protein